jgi:hypothetical protein
VKKYDNTGRLGNEEKIKFSSPSVFKYIHRKTPLDTVFNVEEQIHYDDRGLVVRYTSIWGDTVLDNKYECIYKRDQLGEIKYIKYIIDNQEPQIVVPEIRKKDFNNNWTEILWLDDGIPHRITTRDITYFESYKDRGS